MKIVTYFGLTIGVLLLWGCGGDDSGGTNDSGGDTSDNAPDTEVQDTGSDGPVDTGPDPDAWLETFDAPDAWGPAENCGTVGDSCVNLSGCSGDAICQTEGWVCVPDMLEEGRTFGPEYPYCMSWVCMTYEEASCYCAGEGALLSSDCTIGPKAALGLCSSRGDSCEELACCGDDTCLAINPSESICAQTCSDGSECATGCCTDMYGIGQTVCAPVPECEDPCGLDGAACVDGNDCCQGTCVQSETPDFAGCRPVCLNNEDCSSGCCIPFSNSTDGFCVSDKYCGCLAEWEQCFDAVVPCCAGLECLGYAGDESSYICTRP